MAARTEPGRSSLITTTNAQRPRNFIASSMPVYSQDSTGITAQITVFTEIS
jgi:hypothetical protein